MRAFENFLKAKRQKTLANGAAFVFREVMGGLALLCQTQLPIANGGGTVQGFNIQNTNGIYSTTSNGESFWINLDHPAFDSDYAEFQAALAIQLQDEPTTVSEGVERVAYLNAAVAQLKSILSMG